MASIFSLSWTLIVLSLLDSEAIQVHMAEVIFIDANNFRQIWLKLLQISKCEEEIRKKFCKDWQINLFKKWYLNKQ